MRITAWSLLLFQVLFLNIFLPAHTRGSITMTPRADSSAASCCEMKKPTDTKHAPTQEDRKCCAVCYLASHYVPVEPYITYFDFHALVRQCHELAVAQVRSLDFPLPFWPVGPPSHLV